MDTPTPFGSLLEASADLLPNAVRLRRALHARPELGLDLPHTQERVLEAIDGLGLTVRTGEQTTSVVAVLEGARPGPTILLRADMDALPMPEDTGLEYGSAIDNTMHACGHDLHTAMLAGAAHLLHAHQADIAGRVLFMFQPGEEGHHGARYMLDEGLLDPTLVGDVTGAFALHVSARSPSGTIGLRGGTLMASSDLLCITVTGKGGHASAPHQAVDPIPIACEIVTALQIMVTRRIDAFDPAVVTVNDQPYSDRVLGVAGELLGADRAITMPNPLMGAEDFSYVLQRVPGALAFLGACPAELDPRHAPMNHSNRVTFDEKAMTSGMAIYAAMALRHLGAA